MAQVFPDGLTYEITYFAYELKCRCSCSLQFEKCFLIHMVKLAITLACPYVNNFFSGKLEGRRESLFGRLDVNWSRDRSRNSDIY